MSKKNNMIVEGLIPNLGDLIPVNGKSIIEYDIEKGIAIGFALFKDNNIGIQRAFLTKGTIFDKHVHNDEVEILIVYVGKGKYIDYNTNKETVITVGEFVKVEKGVPHSWEILEDTWVIGITVPASEDYPDA